MIRIGDAHSTAALAAFAAAFLLAVAPAAAAPSRTTLSMSATVRAGCTFSSSPQATPVSRCNADAGPKSEPMAVSRLPVASGPSADGGPREVRYVTISY